MSVVLPAPFGPMMACISPGMTSSVTLSVTTRLPKLLRRLSRRSSGSVMAGLPLKPRNKSKQPAAREQHGQHEYRSEHHFPVLDQPRQHLLGDQIRGAADDRAVQRADAAEDHHNDQLARSLPRHIGRAHELGHV